MKARFLVILAVMAAAFVPVSSSFAADGSGESESKAENTGDKQYDDPVAEAKANALNQRYVRILSNLDTQEAQHFMIIVANYNIISTVKAVQEDVGEASKACVDNNKSMKDSINNRFDAWKSAIASPMVDANAGIQNMIMAQDYLPKAEFQTLFDLIEETRRYNSSRFETTPVTTPEACEFMVSKMDETQDQMVAMLNATQASYPAARKQPQE